MIIDFSRIGPSTALGRWLRLPLRLVPKGAVLPVLQGPLRGARWVAGTSDHGCWLGNYERAKQVEFARLVRPGDVVFDVGAHVGFYSLLASRLVGRGGRIYAFEPMPGNLVRLERHLAINHVKNVDVLATAVSDCSGTAHFDPAVNDRCGHLSSVGTVEVKVASLDQLLADGRISPPRLIKLDVEGAEARVLQGARTLLRTHKPVMLVATHGLDVHRQTLQILDEMGYAVRGLEGVDVSQTDELLATPR